MQSISVTPKCYPGIPSHSVVAAIEGGVGEEPKPQHEEPTPHTQALDETWSIRP
jgi:hypothetical protein